MGSSVTDTLAMIYLSVQLLSFLAIQLFTQISVLCFQSMFRQGGVLVLQSVASLSIYQGRLSVNGIKDMYCKGSYNYSDLYWFC